MAPRLRSLWPGPRGEGYVVAQFLLFTLVLIGPAHPEWLPEWAARTETIAAWAAALLALPGGLLAVLASRFLGPALTPLPRPAEDNRLVRTGPYRFVRHPIYSGIILLALAWGLFRASWLTLGYVAILIAFLWHKTRQEERWLLEAHPDYADYQARVPRLFPFLP